MLAQFLDGQKNDVHIQPYVDQGSIKRIRFNCGNHVQDLKAFEYLPKIRGLAMVNGARSVPINLTFINQLINH